MKAITRSALWRLSGTVASIATLCLAPKVVGVAAGRARPRESRAPHLTNRGHEANEVAIPLRCGTLAATVSWDLDDETHCDLLRGRIEYRPGSDPRGACSSIRFIQVAKTERDNGIDYGWQGLEGRRNFLRSSSKMGPGVQGGYFVDHKASACAPATPCSPYFRDHWPNPDESSDGFQANWGAAPASLVDYPYGWDILAYIALESCARCVETGEFLGCVEWGARWPAVGARTISPISVREGPSPTFLAALRAFEEFYNPRTRRSRSPSSAYLDGR